MSYNQLPILVSSHLMSELQGTAGHLVVVGRGKVVAETSVADLIATASTGQVTLRTTSLAQAVTVLHNIGATVVATGADTLTISGLTAERIVALFGENAVAFSEVSENRATPVWSTPTCNSEKSPPTGETSYFLQRVEVMRRYSNPPGSASELGEFLGAATCHNTTETENQPSAQWQRRLRRDEVALLVEDHGRGASAEELIVATA